MAHAQAPTVAEKAQRERDATAAALVRLIDAEMPSGNSSWQVRFKPQYDLIEVKSDDLVTIFNGMGINGDVDNARKTHEIHPGFSFHVKPFVSPSNYALWKTENAAIYKQLDQMQTQMRDINRKFDSYMPRTDEEKQRVENYEQVKSGLHSLPHFYFADISLSWVLPYDDIAIIPPGLFGSSPGSADRAELEKMPGWMRQEEEIARRVLKLLTRYEPVAVE